MADYDSSLPVKIFDGTDTVGIIAATSALKVDIASITGTAASVTQPLFVELSDGSAAISAANALNVKVGDDTNQAAITAALSALKIDLVGEGGAAIDATNPVFTELTDGTTAISASNPLNVQVGDGTTQVGVIAGTAALKVDLASEGGTAISATNPVIAQLSDGTAVMDNTADHFLPVRISQDGSNFVDGAHPLDVAPAAPSNTFIEYTTATVTSGATDTTNFKKEAASGSIYVNRVILSASGAFKAELKYTEAGASTTKAVGFATSANPMCILEFDNYQACACSQASDGIHISVTNRESSDMDVYCSIIGHT